MTPNPMSEVVARELAVRFHETYDRLAPQFGYETRTETRTFDPASPNGRLMIAVCEALAPTVSERSEGATVGAGVVGWGVEA